MQDERHHKMMARMMHWAHYKVWPILQAVLYWMGDTADLLSKQVPDSQEGSDKFQAKVSTS